jgi:CubicO group peptidase (beta-lactamase class C family)
MIYLKRITVLLAASILWGAFALFGGLNGWWLTPIAPQKDSQAFMKSVKEKANVENKGNIALVLIENKVVFEEYFAASVDNINKDTVFPLASMSKWITAYGVMQLVEAGKINLDAPISHYLTRWKLPESNFDNNKVTVRQLLAHTSGLTDGLGFGDYGPQETIPSLESSLTKTRTSTGTKIISLGRKPGEEWDYSGGGYLILQLIVEEVSGMLFSEWMQQAVFDPLDMSRTTYSYLGNLENTSKSYDADGKAAIMYRYAASAATGLSSSSSDLVKFAQAQLSASRGSKDVLGLSNVDEMRQPIGHKFGADIWGLGTMLYAPTSNGGYVFGHDGSNEPAINTALRINPVNGDGIIVLVIGNTLLASSIAYEWTLWQTGYPDFLMLDKAINSSVIPIFTGLGVIILIFTIFVFKRRKHN